jgi:glycosyltransferase involved in cell wall biosynthesis
VTRPLASIVIPVYNQSPTLLDAAVDSALAQTVPVEVIVVDDGSDTPAPARPGVVLIRHDENRGIAAALNSGIANMTAKRFCWLSSDDTLAPAKVEIQGGALDTSGMRCGFHAYRTVYPTGYVQQPGQMSSGDIVLPQLWNTHGEQVRLFAQGCYVNGSTVMVDRVVFDLVGPFDITYRYGQDWEFWCRSGQRFRWHYIPLVLGTRTEHDNLTARKLRDPVMNARALDEDNRIREFYGKR